MQYAVRNAIPVAVVLSSGLLLWSCSRPAAGGWEGETIVRGDTTIVRTASGSVWDAPAELVEDWSVGSIDGAEEEMFGRIADVAPDGEGGAYVFDGTVPALRHYGADGRYLGTLGREGSGPGEYRDASLGLSVLRDGRLYMRDPRNARLNIYSPDGRPDGQWRIDSGLFTANATVVDTAGNVYLKILAGEIEPDKPWPVGLLHLDPSGEIVDTLEIPVLAGEPAAAGGTFLPTKVWEMSPWGELVVGVNDEYAFELHRRDGTVLRIEKEWQPVAVDSDERAEREASNDYVRATQGRFMTAEIPPVPDSKPAYRGFFFDEEGGRIWVHRYAPSEKGEPEAARTIPGNPDAEPPMITWREPTVFDVFTTQGTYLGEVRLPDRTTVRAIRANEV